MKYVIGSQKTHDGVKIIFPNSIPLLNPKPPKYSSSQTNAKFHKIKKGSSIYRRILYRDLDLITSTRQKSWRKTTRDHTVEMETIRNTFKSINYSDIPASDHDALVRFYLRKTTFNWQNHKIYPNQATRPEWAHRLNCWSCEMFYITLRP
jgi:hypothetical protein